jgi:hypothetical protein
LLTGEGEGGAGAEPNHPTVRLKIIHYSLAGCKRVTTTFIQYRLGEEKVSISEAGEQAHIEYTVLSFKFESLTKEQRN